MTVEHNQTVNFEYIKLGVSHDVMTYVRNAKWELRRGHGEILRTAISFGLMAMGVVETPDGDQAPFVGAEPVLRLNPETGRLKLVGWTGDL